MLKPREFLVQPTPSFLSSLGKEDEEETQESPSGLCDQRSCQKGVPGEPSGRLTLRRRGEGGRVYRAGNGH